MNIRSEEEPITFIKYTKFSFISKKLSSTTTETINGQPHLLKSYDIEAIYEGPTFSAINGSLEYTLNTGDKVTISSLGALNSQVTGEGGLTGFYVDSANKKICCWVTDSNLESATFLDVSMGDNVTIYLISSTSLICTLVIPITYYYDYVVNGIDPNSKPKPNIPSNKPSSKNTLRSKLRKGHITRFIKAYYQLQNKEIK